VLDVLVMRLVVIALLASAPIPCSICGWATDGDRRQLELEMPILAIEEELCTACRERTR
jgi:hypothetical protein